MGTIIRAIIALVVAGVLLWMGYDDLMVYLNHSEVKTFAIEDIEQGGIGDARYIEVGDGSPIGTFVYETRDNVPTKLYYPLLSEESIGAFLEDESQPLIAKVVVSTSKFEAACIEQENCADPGARTVRGVVQVGLNSIDQETRDLFADSSFALDENVVYIDADSEPQMLWGMIKLGAGLLFLIYAIGSLLWNRLTRSKDIPLPMPQPTA
jgi:hypothetical protein